MIWTRCRSRSIERVVTVLSGSFAAEKREIAEPCGGADAETVAVKGASAGAMAYVHFDVDYFFAQVEEPDNARDPRVRLVEVGRRAADARLRRAEARVGDGARAPLDSSVPDVVERQRWRRC